MLLWSSVYAKETYVKEPRINLIIIILIIYNLKITYTL